MKTNNKFKKTVLRGVAYDIKHHQLPPSRIVRDYGISISTYYRWRGK